jgi:hypothetical protein
MPHPSIAIGRRLPADYRRASDPHCASPALRRPRECPPVEVFSDGLEVLLEEVCRDQYYKRLESTENLGRIAEGATSLTPRRFLTRTALRTTNSPILDSKQP